ncbi:FtsK/SpoIIIE domain-containing protein [Enteractinococcus coprophilus]|uniref:S-DNA-T family DNA segregation ATPase FtsK/SpoIIIE n=1 Tax=Enteractinococcus coprophilus TaxID=1027633 RepID=A0A543AP01_9MICC|nr:FtsK/SpoIIIE domain-containing protein [Enteractinococcus coprophilus]TQL74298.1 S-DNA-T family DNA segregation ATPase FtsK/SpoIIIE [Enteractinococcus coprophilus]
MRILLDLDGSSQVVNLNGFQPQATLADLTESALGYRLADDDRLYVDQLPVTGETTLADCTILEGSVISRKAPEQTGNIAGWNVVISGGFAVGTVVVVPDHRPLVIGRAPQADLVLPTESASWHHCTIELTDDGALIKDSDSTNGTYVDGVAVDGEGTVVTEAATVQAGGAILSVEPFRHDPVAPAPGSLKNLTPAGTAPFNRPPRPGLPPKPEAIEPPAPEEVNDQARFSLVTVIAPLIMAGVLVVVLGNPRFALFALLSPMMAIGMYFEQKRRRKKNLAAEEERFSQAIKDFDHEITDAAAAEIQRRHELIPDPATVMRRLALPSTLMWQRRPDATDYLYLHAGIGDIPWQPELDDRGSQKYHERVRKVLDASQLTAAPVLVDLKNAGVVGIVGDREGALALARSLLVQATVHVGPADLSVGVFCDHGREDVWDWAAWLPHTKQPGTSSGAHWMSNQRDASDAMLRGLMDNINGLPADGLLLVIDSEVLTEGRNSPARDLLGHGRDTGGVRILRADERRTQVSGIVIATTTDQLPAACTTVIEVGQDASASVHHPENLIDVDDVVLAGVSLEDAEACARRLAQFEDPELVVPGAALPSLVRLPELLGVEELNADTIQDLWRSPGMSGPVGVSEKGTVFLDIVKDGPHGLVGGTTGSGKSEFLRSFIAGLAARNSPETLSFILIDFKGGAAFKAAERLPHTIGTISNLDEQLADRALRALEAEMERRQRLFAQAGEDIDNLPAYLATNPPEPLPRLLLVIDEFAMLAKDFPDVLASLVSVAAVGRTLGVHMILATQRPAGVVNEDILANTNLRVALRVQSREDSSNVIGVPDAASIERSQMGRAYIKLGQDDITPVQTALVTGKAQEHVTEKVEIQDVGLFGQLIPRETSVPKASSSDENDFDLLIDAVIAANQAAGFAPPRQVWPEALGERVRLDGYTANTAEDPQDRPVPAVGGVDRGIVRVALADEPDLQRQSATGWDMHEGNLMLMGVRGSGTTTTLASIGLALAATRPPQELDLLCLDVGSRGLAELERLPHTVAYVGAGPGAKEQQVRFMRFLRTEFNRRRETSVKQRDMVILFDGLATFKDEFTDFEGQEHLETLYRVYADGPAVGMHFVVTTTRAKAVPPAMDEVTTQRWVYRLADAYDYSALGVKGKNVPSEVPGRCVDVNTLLQMHIATPDQGLEAAVTEAVERWADAPAKADVIGVLPENVAASTLAPHLDLTEEPLRIPVGISEDTLQPTMLEVFEEEHILIAGPARSGKSTLLCAIAELLLNAPAGQRPAVWGISNRRSPLGELPLDKIAETPDDIPGMLALLRLETGPVFLLIDDAERVDDADQSIAGLLTSTNPRVCVVAAGRAGDLRSQYGHWTKKLSKARCGVLLQPDVDFDGDLLNVKIPRRAPVAMTTGRGYAGVGGSVSLIQSMSPTDHVESSQPPLESQAKL